MNGRRLKEQAELLRSILSAIVLVSSAAGSLVNILRGHSLPTVISAGVLVTVVVFIYTEIKDRRDRRREERKIVQELDAARLRAADAPQPHPIVIREDRAAPVERLYRNPDGRLVLRLVAPRSPEPPT